MGDIHIIKWRPEWREFLLEERPGRTDLLVDRIRSLEGIKSVRLSTRGSSFVIEVQSQQRYGGNEALWRRAFSLVAAASDWRVGLDQVTVTA